MKLATTLLATTAAGAIAFAAAVALNGPENKTGQLMSPGTVKIEPGLIDYRLPGEYLASGHPVDAPVTPVRFPDGFEMMQYQVSAGDYALCVADGNCKPADGAQAGADLPVTGIDYKDAVNYADWLSDRTGEGWRLPTDAEWTFAAAERFRDEILGPAGDVNNPAARWLAQYRQEASNAAPLPEPQSFGHFGTNGKGVADIAGNVWEWTSTCYVRATVEPDGQLARRIENCGVRVAAGRHRAYMSFFIRDGKSGGCAAGLAPTNLGIRLVRDPPSLLARMKALVSLDG